MLHSAQPAHALGMNTLSARLAKVSVLIADEDHKVALLVKAVLQSLGFKQIYIVNDGTEGLSVLKAHEIDFVISDWQMTPMDGMDLLRYIRSAESPNRMLPVILLTARGEQEDVEAARGAGITEYVIKPFSARTLLERIVLIVEHPRSFILCRNYVGPDRRPQGVPPGSERRKEEGEVRPPRAMTREQLKHVKESEIDDDTPIVVLPDYAIKKKIGPDVDINQIVSKPVLAHSQQIITDAQGEFLTLLTQDMEKLRQAFEALKSDRDHSRTHAMALRDTALTIKGRAGTIGYSRASEVAQLLYHFMSKPMANPEHRAIVIEKHIATLGVIFEFHMTGDGGSHGRELIEELGHLISKYL